MEVASKTNNSPSLLKSMCTVVPDASCIVEEPSVPKLGFGCVALRSALSQAWCESVARQHTSADPDNTIAELLRPAVSCACIELIDSDAYESARLQPR